MADSGLTPKPRPAPAAELSPIDLWLTLVGHKKTFFTGFSLCLLLGLVVAVFNPARYTYSVALQIGYKTPGTDANTVLIESPATVVAKLQESYIPQAVIHYKKAHPEDTGRYELRTRIPAKSDLVIVEAYGSKAREKIILSLLEQSAAALQKDHQRISDAEFSRLEIDINRARVDLNTASSKFDELAEQADLIKADIHRLGDTKTLLLKQTEVLNKHIQAALQQRQRAITQAGDQAHAMTVLLIDSELDNSRTRLAELERRVVVDLNGERDKYQKQLADIKRQQTIQQQRIQTQIQTLEALKLGKKSLRTTTVLAPPTRSLLATGPGWPAIIGLAVLLGLAVGLVMSFTTAFLQKARDYQSVSQ